MRLLLGEDELPLIVAQSDELAVVVPVEELVARDGCLPSERIGQVVAVEMDLERFVADPHALRELLFHVGHACSGQ